MAEELTPPATPPEQAPVTAPVGMLNDDGRTFVKDWQKQLGDETLHEDQTLATIKDIDSLSKSYVHVRKQVPMDKMPRPNENWGDSEWDEFYKAGGRPDTAADFGIKLAEGIPEEFMPKEIIEGYQDLFHKIGLSKKQVEAIVAHNDGLTLANLQANEQQTELDINARNDAVHDLWGVAFEQKSHLGNLAIEKGYGNDFTDDEKDWLVEHVNDPKNIVLLKWASNLGSHFAEDKLIENTNIPTAADTDEKIREAMGMTLSREEARKHPYQNAKHPEHARQVELVRKLHESKNKRKVG